MQETGTDKDVFLGRRSKAVSPVFRRLAYHLLAVLTVQTLCVLERNTVNIQYLSMI